jgi:hypothetical protein
VSAARSRRLARAGVALTLVLAADQTVQYTALRDGELFGARAAPFDPPLFTPWQRRAARSVADIAEGREPVGEGSQFDPELGWCPRPGQESELYRHDWAGARLQLEPLAREKTPDMRRVVALGCSFTQGAEVEGRETWSALLDERHGDLEVANLGVAGYGIDQALLRLRRDGLRLAPDEVWLGFMPLASLRITAQFTPTLLHWSTVLGFKPLFTLGPGDELVLVPSPARDLAGFRRLLEDQSVFLAALGSTDLWVRRRPEAWAPWGSSWTHRCAAWRLFTAWRESGGREPERELRDAGGEVYRTLRAIVRAFARESADAGARFRLLVLPSRKDLRSAESDGAYWQALVQELSTGGIEALDLTPAFLAVHAAAEPSFWMPHEHYSPRAHRLVADELERALAR